MAIFPKLKLVFGTKVVKKNQSRGSCSLYLKIFHLRCFGTDDSETLCNSCYFSNNNDIDGSEQMQQVDSQHYDITKLSEVSRRKGLNILHPNIRGLLANKDSICQILDSFRNSLIISEKSMVTLTFLFGFQQPILRSPFSA